MKTFKISYILIITSFLILAWSCKDDYLGLTSGNDMIEGEKVTLNVKFTIPEMPVSSRAAGIDPESETAKTVRDIWVGIYNSNTGKRTGYTYISGSPLIDNDESHLTPDGEIKIGTESGYSFIVAVANIGTSNGIQMGKKRGSLVDLLNSAETWKEFKEISYVMSNPQSIQRLDAILMSGIYIEGDSHSGGSSKDNYTEIFIDNDGNPTKAVAIYPETKSLDGFIHLRRLSSYVKVNISGDKFVNFVPESWQIFNLPGVSYLNERGKQNAADKNLSEFLPANYGGENYHASIQYGYASFDINGDSYSFDFYQMENKHEGRDNVEGVTDINYNYREQEYKNSVGETATNTGWYKSLVERAGDKIPASPDYGELSNNNASYLVIKGKLDYYYDGSLQPLTYAPVDGSVNNPNYIQRVADVTYTIHLGYCEGKENGLPTAETARDFNCRRNTKYTYNIIVAGADKIRVEATKEDDELQPGVEGVVSDVVDEPPINIDCHYGVFNIALTDKQRANLIWRIQSPFGNNVIDMMGGSKELEFPVSSSIDLTSAKEKDKREALPDNQFYNWIQIRPTTDANTIAHYPGDPRLIGRNITDYENNGLYDTSNIKEAAVKTNLGDDRNGVWYLQELCNPYKYKWNDGEGIVIDNPNYEEGLDETVHYYTVFIDEYVYEYDYNPSLPRMTGKNTQDWKNDLMDLRDWRNFVNRPNRLLWITESNMFVSPDQESIYNLTLYFLNQESIQTFYSDDAETAFGIELTNESYKTRYNSTNNSQMTWKDYNNGKYSGEDGLLNLYNFIKSENRVWENISGNVINNTFRIGQIHKGNIAKDSKFFIPDHPDEYMTACMARNRDLNNDNKIDLNEMRWYLPTDAVYTRIVLGGVSLRSPLFNLKEYDPADLNGGKGAAYSHYASSNKRMTWAEEFTATSPLNAYGGESGTLRCIRNLGQAMNLKPTEEETDEYKPILSAYSVDEKNRIITMTYYRAEALREVTNSFLPPHDVSEEYSLTTRSFKYAEADCNPSNCVGIDQTILNVDGILGNNFYNSSKDGQPLWRESLIKNEIASLYFEEAEEKDKGTWRIPNINEVAILNLLNIECFQQHSHISCSTEYFNREGTEGIHNFMGIHMVDNIGTNISANLSQDNGKIRLRLVKDISD